MNLLFRLKNFDDIPQAKEYIAKVLPKRDNYYFFNNNRLQQINKNETIYFSFLGYIIASAIFEGERIKDEERDEKFIFGHKLSDVKVIDSNLKLDIKIFSTNTTYLNTKSKLDEITKILQS